MFIGVLALPYEGPPILLFDLLSVCSSVRPSVPQSVHPSASFDVEAVLRYSINPRISERSSDFEAIFRCRKNLSMSERSSDSEAIVILYSTTERDRKNQRSEFERLAKERSALLPPHQPTDRSTDRTNDQPTN